MCYIKYFKPLYIVLLLYIDDILIAGSDTRKINGLNKQLNVEFEMDLGARKPILNMSVIRGRITRSLQLSQEK